MKYSRIYLGGISMFYRECGSSGKPVMLLLHGFPSASHQFRNLMPRLEANFHCIAPDYPGFGQSDAPGRESFTYSFDSLSPPLLLLLYRFYPPRDRRRIGKNV